MLGMHPSLGGRGAFSLGGEKQIRQVVQRQSRIYIHLNVSCGENMVVMDRGGDVVEDRQMGESWTVFPSIAEADEFLECVCPISEDRRLLIQNPSNFAVDTLRVQSENKAGDWGKSWRCSFGLGSCLPRSRTHTPARLAGIPHGLGFSCKRGAW